MARTKFGLLEAAAAAGMSRRMLLATIGTAFAGLGMSGIMARAVAEPLAAIRNPDTAPGSAGALYKRIFGKLGLLKKNGIEIAWVPGQPADSETELIAGTLDLGSFGAIGATQLNLRGVPIRLIAPSIFNHVSWIVRGDSPYKSIADLRGKAIATQPEATETYRTTWMTAQMAGIDFKNEYKVFTGAPPAILALFERGDVEALAITEPIATRLVGRGHRQIARINDLWQEYSGATSPMLLVGVAAKQTWIDQNAQAYRRYVATHMECLQFIQDHPEVIREFAVEIGVPATETKAIELLPERVKPAFAPRWDEQEFKGVEQQVDEAIRLGILPRRAETSFLVPLPA